jgi:amidohydrolase
LIASEFVVQAQTIVSRRVPPFNPAVVTFGTLNSGYRYNIIAKYAELTGTVRTFDKGTQDLIGKELKRILDGLSKATGCKYEFSYIKGYPATINNERVSKVVEEAASEVLGEEGVVHPNPSMGGEDFAYYLRKIPGAYYFLGIGNKEKGIVSPEHSSTHKIDESVLKYGTEILQRSAKKLLS